MPFVLFHDLCPTIAEAETRTLTLPTPQKGIPAGSYAFLEMFCDEVICDCRRVMFMVMSASRNVEAVIAWGWENVDFYDEWLGRIDPAIAAEMKGPCLNLGSPQSKIAPALLDLVNQVLLADAAYVDRVKRHYALFRSKIGRPTGKKKSSKEAARERRQRWKR